jgi:bisphosphoglycerate-dependent phosphoglycerate mutase
MSLFWSFCVRNLIVQLKFNFDVWFMTCSFLIFQFVLHVDDLNNFSATYTYEINSTKPHNKFTYEQIIGTNKQSNYTNYTYEQICILFGSYCWYI